MACAGAYATSGDVRLLDDLRDATPWQASASDQVKSALRRDSDGSLCLDYDFGQVSGYAVMRRALPQTWPAHFDLTLKLKGQGARNDFQFKLVDASGDNVWWVNKPEFALPTRLQDVRLKSRQIGFAWGTTTERRLTQTAALELVIAAGAAGGKGSLCLAQIALTKLAAAPATPPLPIAHASVGDAALALDGRTDTAWRAPGKAQHLALDFGYPREFNGISLQWLSGAHAPDYDLLASDDARHWRVLRRVRGAGGGWDALFLPDTESRYLRLNVLRSVGAQLALAELQLHDDRQWPTSDAMLTSVAAQLPKGQLPRAYLRQQNYWTLIGVDGGGARSGLISEDGAIELGRGGPSIEPAVRLDDDGSLVTWADVEVKQSLRDGYLPMPAVQWTHPRFSLEVEAAADGPQPAPQLLARYTLRNPGDKPLALTLLLALRPWQVNPPQQFLATPGGVSPIRRLAWDGRALRVNEGTTLWPVPAPRSVRAASFDAGLGLTSLLQAPTLKRLQDPQAMASGLMQFKLVLPPHGSRTLGWVAPMGGLGAAPSGKATQDLAPRFEAVAALWRERLNRTKLQVPPQAQAIADTLRTSLAYILMSRDGAALRPGTRSYARAWVRDGAMMVEGLLQLGEVQAAREFVDWYAPRVFAAGKVPCCVDARGADPVVENDSQGQYLFAVAELWRHTQDLTLLRRHWPTIERVTAYMEGLRQSERTAANRVAGRERFFGLMPPSISHEGYSDKAAYSYWDDFWTLRGYKDAALMAAALGHAEQARQWAGWRDEFQRELMASIAATAAHYGQDHIAGAADRGDFDATSSTIALNPAQAQDALPPGLLEQTFERYWQSSLARAQGRRAAPDYTPYELRCVGALLRLGRPQQAQAMLDFFFKDQRPRGWNQWAEVVLPDAREPHFLGDMPHAWVASDYIRSALDLFAFEREAEHSLVLGAGLQLEWLDGPGVALQGLSTAYGKLGYSLARSAVGAGWVLNLQPGLHGLLGGLRLMWPGEAALPAASSRGQVLPWSGRELHIPADATQILLRPSQG